METDALLRDNNFGPDDFSDAVLKNIGFDDWSVSNEKEESLAKRRDFRQEITFTIDPNGSEELDDALHVKEIGNGKVEIGIHVADAAHFVKANSLVDREARKRGTGVYLMNRAVPMLPSRLSSEICSLSPGEARFTVSVVFQVDRESGSVVDDQIWIGKSIINSSGKLSYEEVDAVLHGDNDVKLQGATVKDIKILQVRDTSDWNSISSNVSDRVLLRNSAKRAMVYAARRFHRFDFSTSWMMRTSLSSTTSLTRLLRTSSLRSLVIRQTLSLRRRSQEPSKTERSSDVTLRPSQRGYRSLLRG